MANVISNNNVGVAANVNQDDKNTALYKSSSVGVTNLQDCCQLLKQSDPKVIPPGSSPYDHIIEMIRGLDLHDDGIQMNHKIKDIESVFCNVILDEHMLCESMEYINDKALDDHDTSMKFAILFSSHNFDVLAMKETKVRSAMINILETNFFNADIYRDTDKNRLYNSITLLGEYYHRVRLVTNEPITILGKSLLSLLIREVEQTEPISVRLAKLILSQITLNGYNMRSRHKEDLTMLLYHIRRNVIEQHNLKSRVKALLMMSLDLYYSNFKNLGKDLEEMYTKYLVEHDEDDDEETQNHNNNSQISKQHPQAMNTIATRQPEEPSLQNIPPPTNLQQENFANPAAYSLYNNQDSQASSFKQELEPEPSAADTNNDLNNGDDSFENDSFSQKKWSEQLFEDSFCEDVVEPLKENSPTNEETTTASYSETHQNDDRSESDHSRRNNRRSYQPRASPRPLKQKTNTNQRFHTGDHSQHTQTTSEEDRDETKPLPRWRTTRFNNREGNEKNNGRHNQRRFSNHMEDDRKSERSENGSIRLYSVNDRLKHVQEKFERNSNNYNIANSNWDRQSQRDDRSERSYLSNYERGGNRKGTRHFNNRQVYDKPPRFQKQQNNEKSHSPQNHRETKIQSESWRRSNSQLHHRDYDNRSYDRDDNSTRSRTLPRPRKNRMDENANGKQNVHYNNQQKENYNRENSNKHKNSQPRYGSHNSLNSETSNTLERNRGHRPRQHNYKNRSQDWDDDTRSVQSTHTENNENWNSGRNESELVRNAQQTTKYMNYLSSK